MCVGQLTFPKGRFLPTLNATAIKVIRAGSDKLTQDYYQSSLTNTYSTHSHGAKLKQFRYWSLQVDQ